MKKKSLPRKFGDPLTNLSPMQPISPIKQQTRIVKEITFTNKTLEHTMLNIVYNNPVLKPCFKRSEEPTAEMLAYHGISVQNRERIIDWVLQVLHALSVETPSTFFAAVSYIDRYLVAKYIK